MIHDYSKFENIDVSTLGFKKGAFATWSPFAKKVSLLFYKDFKAVKENCVTEEFEMKKSEGGVWILSAMEVKDIVKKNLYYHIGIALYCYYVLLKNNFQVASNLEPFVA